MHITLFLELMHIMTPRGERPRYLSKIYLPYLFLLSFSWPATHHNNFHSFGSILNRHCFLWHNISVVSSSMCQCFDFCLTKNQGLGLFFTYWISWAEYILVSCAKFITKLCLFSIYTCLMLIIFFLMYGSCNSLLVIPHKWMNLLLHPPFFS